MNANAAIVKFNGYFLGQPNHCIKNLTESLGRLRELFNDKRKSVLFNTIFDGIEDTVALFFPEKL